MSLKFIDSIMTEIDMYSLDKGYNWNIVQQSSPARKEWNDLPMVIICPQNEVDVKFMAFCGKSITNKYNLFLVSSGAGLVNVPNEQHENFMNSMVDLFMPMPTSIAIEGAWQSRVVPRYNFDRSMFPNAYIVTMVELNVSWIQ